MAKRKRLEIPVSAKSPDLETEPGRSSPMSSRARMPIADIAGETAALASLETVARAMTEAEQEGRIVKRIPLDRVVIHHLPRDRMSIDNEDMEALTASLADRGQQTPIEVVDNADGTYGLISGLRRMKALEALGVENVLALVKQPENAEAAYIAMVEENEIRSALSFYERANIAVASVEAGIHPTVKTAVARLFAHVSASKRSKILKFVVLRNKLGNALGFPAAISEKLGLALASAIEADPKVATRIKDALRKTPARDAKAERQVFERALKPTPTSTEKTSQSNVPDGIVVTPDRGRVVLSGAGVDERFIAALRTWISQYDQAE